MKSIVCPKCNWKWNIEKKDENPHLCHKCGFDNMLKKYDYKSYNKWKNKNSNIYDDVVNNDCIIRTFKENINELDLVWHRDKQDRIVEAISADEWYLQYDNMLPIKIQKNIKYKIEKNIYHRLIKKSGQLKIKIYM